jgi:hypothetical protein
MSPSISAGECAHQAARLAIFLSARMHPLCGVRSLIAQQELLEQSLQNLDRAALG